MTVRLLPDGERGLLVELPESEDVVERAAGLATRLARDGRPGVVDLVPALRTVLVVFDPGVTTRASVEQWVSEITRIPIERASRTGATVVVVVRYDGPDLGAVAEVAELSTAEVVRRHAAGTYHSAFCGFAPGFAYLMGLDRQLHVPRLSTPRTRVDAGSVAIAGPFTGVYPQAMPGGWRVIGHTDAVVWDAARAAPALLEPGTTVRFRATR